MNTTQKQYQTDEIDPRELFKTLWNSKILIFVITILFAIAGVTYALLAQQEWSANASVVAPLPSQVEQLRLRAEHISKVINPANLVSILSEEKLFSNYIQAFNSFDNKCEFIKINGYVPLEDRKQERGLQRYLEEYAKKINAIQPKNAPNFTLFFSADSAQEAKKRLSAYLDFIQAKEEKRINIYLRNIITDQTKVQTLYYQVLKTDTLKRLQEDISRTEFAVRISKTAGVEAPVQNLNNQTFFPIDLGAKALNEKLKILKEIKNPEVLNPALADLRLSLDTLEALPQEYVVFTSYYFLKSPTESLNRDKPKRSFLVVLATLTGLILGVMSALFHAHRISGGVRISLT